jgi:multisubunit Na+/H+ antiporter MnhB subunit
VAAAVVALALAWRHRHRIREQPLRTVRQGVRVASWTAAGIGLLFVLGAVVAPAGTYSIIAWFAQDYSQWAAGTDFGPVVLVLIVALEFLSAAVLGFLLVPLAQLWRNARGKREAQGGPASPDTGRSGPPRPKG